MRAPVAGGNLAVMKADQFSAWFEGFLEAVGADRLTAEQCKTLQRRISDVVHPRYRPGCVGPRKALTGTCDCCTDSLDLRLVQTDKGLRWRKTHANGASLLRLEEMADRYWWLVDTLVDG